MQGSVLRGPRMGSFKILVNRDAYLSKRNNKMVREIGSAWRGSRLGITTANVQYAPLAKDKFTRRRGGVGNMTPNAQYVYPLEA